MTLFANLNSIKKQMDFQLISQTKDE